MKALRRILFLAGTLLAGMAAANDLSAILGARAGFSAVGNFSIAGTATGAPDKLTLKATLQVAPEDAGKKGAIYVIAALRGMVFFKEASGMWSLWNGGSFPAYFQGPLGTHAVDIVADLDSTQLPGIAFYVGYGLDQADMLANGKYSQISTKPQAPPTALEGIWEMLSSSGPFFGQPPEYIAFDATDVMVGVDVDGCSFAATYVVSGNVITVTIVANDANAQCGGEEKPGTVHRFEYVLDQNGLTLKAGDGSTALFQKIVIP